MTTTPIQNISAPLPDEATDIQNIPTPLPIKTDDMTWDAFTEAVVEAEEAEEARLLQAFPTPAMTAERGTDAWSLEWKAQHKASSYRKTLLMAYNSKLILEIGKAVAAAVPNFQSLDVEYEGCGDSGESCDITVYTDRPFQRDADGKVIPWTNEENEAFSKQQDAANNLIPSDLTEWMDETCWAIAYNEHPGFEINAGGYGSIVVAPADEDDASSPLQLTISHTQRVEQSYEDVVLA